MERRPGLITYTCVAMHAAPLGTVSGTPYSIRGLFRLTQSRWIVTA